MVGDKGLGSACQTERCLANWAWLTFGIHVEPFARAIDLVDAQLIDFPVLIDFNEPVSMAHARIPVIQAGACI